MEIHNTLTDVMVNPKAKLLNIYCTAGYPNIEDTSIVISSLESAGVDMIELGIPFSDPLADGPTIQKSSKIALDNGMTLKRLFTQLKQTKFKVPIILMGYLNPVLQYGIEKFCSDCQELGISGVILPDLPIDLFVSNYKHIFEKHQLCNICLITPQTTEERIRYIDKHSSGFIYAVSSSSTTGSKSTIDGVDQYLSRLKTMQLKNPIMTGFNIHDKKTFNTASEHTSGGIIGSAFIRAITNTTDLEKSITTFVKTIIT